MNRREFLLAPLLASAAAAQRRSRPNVILVITDDQGYGDLSIHGNPHLRTPNMDRVAAEGIRFDQFHVNPVCSPTRASLMTGRYYYRTGVVDTYLGRSMMWSDEVTLPEMLRAAGYRTGIFGKWHLGDHRPLRPQDQGFEETLIHHGGGIGQPSDPPGGDHYFDATLFRNGGAFKSKGYCTDVFFDATMDFVARHRNEPFFAYLATNAPHGPLEIDPKYVEPFTAAGLDANTAKCYGMIRNLDENMGRLLAKLDELQIARNTIFIFMTDNGPQWNRYNAGMRDRKESVYEGGIRVPFFVRWPERIAAGVVDRHLAAHIDILPTLVEACGAAVPRNVKIDGRSLVPLLSGGSSSKAWADRTLFFQWHRGDRGRLYDSCAARNQRYKLVNGVELYDLEKDPGETTDIAQANPDVVAKLRGDYEAWFGDVSATRNFQPPRIYLGDPQEPVVLLTRQDWRGEKASWDKTGLGHWEVEVRAAGAYDVKFLFAPSKSAMGLAASVGGVTRRVDVAAGAGEVRVRFEGVKKGPTRVEAELSEGRGVQYVEVRRA